MIHFFESLPKEYYFLALAALLPVVVAGLLFIIDKKTAFGKLPYMLKQVVFGIIFGGLAVLSTEFGVPISGAQMNCRDAAVLTGGLLFGGPAGIIAGLIGGIERWFAVYWGVGTYTRVACSVSTAIAGIYAALLRRYMFEDKKPGWILSLAIGTVMEVFHMTMVFITNMSDPDKAMAVVKNCTTWMVPANAISVMVATIVVALLSRERLIPKRENVRIAQTIQRSLLITVVLAFLVTTVFVFRLQSEIADKQTESLLELGIKEVSNDVRDDSDENIIEVTKTVKRRVRNGEDINAIAEELDIAEISLINESGKIYQSTVDGYIDFDMHSGEQAQEFLCLLEGEEIFVQEYGPITKNPSVSRKYAGIKYENGFIQVGYDAEQFQIDIALHTVNVSKNRHIGETGFIVVIDGNENVVSARSDLLKSNLKKDFADISDPKYKEGKIFEKVVNGNKCFCKYEKEEGYLIISVYPEEEALKTRNVAIYVNSFMEVLVFAALFVFIYIIIKRVVVNQIKQINASLAKISSGNLSEEVNVRSNEEFASLSNDINTTVETLKSYIAEASARIDKELEFAKSIQSSALPSIFPAFPKRKDFDIFASMNTAKEVGGDFYDFYLTDENKLNFLIADVSGKGIPAAMFMMRAKTELKSLTETGMSLDEVFTKGNAALCEGNDAGMFVTAWQGCIDLETGIIKYVNAGHNPPLVRHQDGTFEYLKGRTGFVLAGMDTVKYRMQEIQMQPGDIIYLYTDGVTEATNAEEKLYSEERLQMLLNNSQFENVKNLCETVTADLDKFVGEADQFDDITMLSVQYFGPKPEVVIQHDRASIEDIPAVTEIIESELEKLDCPMKTTIQMNIAIDEIYSNIAKFAYKDGNGPVTVKLAELDDPHGVKITFIDEGLPYNPVTKEDPDVTLSAEERKIGGLGIFMVKKSMDDMQYQYINDKNILVLIKYF